MKKSFGIIFDWDGVIIDSSEYHEESWQRLSRELHENLSAGHFLKGFGMKNEYIIPEILGWTKDPVKIKEISLRKEAIYREIVSEKGVSTLPGVTEWLEYLAESNIACAIGTSTPLENITHAMRILGIGEYFKGIVTGDDVTAGKPDPQVFLLAAEKINFPPARSVVFEDAPVGIEAALAGGMKAVGVLGTHPRSQLTKANRIVERLDDQTVEDLEELF